MIQIAGYVLCLLFVCTCGEIYSRPEHRFETIIEDGIPIVVTTGGPKYSGELFRYEVMLRLTLDPDNLESLLNRPSAIVQGPGGEYLVCDEGDRRIAVFNTEGNYIRSFGGRGSGPGEFQTIELIGISDGILTLFDSSLQRTTLFSTTGDLLGVYAVRILERADALFILENGSQVCLHRKIELRGEEDWRAMKGIIISPDGDTIASLETPFIHRRMWLRRQVSVSYYVYFATFPRIGYVPVKGLFFYDPANPELRWFDENGKPIHTYRIDLPRIVPPPQDRAQIREEWNQRVESDPIAGTVRQNLVFGDYVPFWSTVLIDGDGYCWLSLYELSSRKEEIGGTAFRVLSPAGEYLGVTRWPFVAFESDHIHRANIAGGLLMAIMAADEGEESVPTVYRIIPAIDGFIYP